VKVVVTGAAGFIGSHLAERLAALGHAVRGIDCLTDFYPSALKERNAAAVRASGADLRLLDLAADDLTGAVHDAEIIFHLAAQPGLSPGSTFESYVRDNLTATHRLLEAARGAGALRGFLYISTSSVYGADATGDETTEPRPTSYYGVTKLAAEQLTLAATRDRGFPACSLRLFSVYGPRERPDKLYPRLIDALLTDQPFPLYEGSEHHRRSYTYVGDIVEGLVRAMGRLDRCVGEIINLGADTAITTGEGIRIVEEIIGRPAKIAPMPRRAGDQLQTRANIAKARRLLDYTPATTPREGLAREVAWRRQELGLASSPKER
jgi:nucleoside-diphosphate-sugar epimerase